MKLTSRYTTNLFARPERAILVLVALTTLLVVLQIVIIVLNFKDLPPQLPLWYSLPWGEGRLTHPIWLWVLPGVSGGVMIFNLVVGQISSQGILSRILSASALLTAVMASLTLIKIILLGQP